MCVQMLQRDVLPPSSGWLNYIPSSNILIQNVEQIYDATDVVTQMTTIQNAVVAGII
jgi:hypothetical protein